MEITGIIKLIKQTEQVTDSFKKRELIITTEEQYPQHILIEFSQDKCDILNKYKSGEQVKVSINLRGREWVNPKGETKYFNSIQGWKIEKLQAHAPVTGQTPTVPNSNVFEPLTQESDTDDLPF